jgi:hypothetical protein
MSEESIGCPAPGAVAEDGADAGIPAPHLLLDVVRRLRARERGYVAGLLHDGPMQELAAAPLMLAEARRATGASRSGELGLVAQQVDAAGRSLRCLQDELWPFPRSASGLATALNRRTAWLLATPLAVDAGEGAAGLLEAEIQVVADVVGTPTRKTTHGSVSAHQAGADHLCSPGWGRSSPAAGQFEPEAAQRIQVSAAGRAVSRSLPIGCPHRSHTPYWPASSRRSAASMPASRSRAASSSAAACWRSNASVAPSGSCSSSVPAELAASARIANSRSSAAACCLARRRAASSSSRAAVIVRGYLRPCPRPVPLLQVSLMLPR